MQIIVGLGNPGKEYEKTRHNVGFIVLDSYLGNVNWKKENDALTYEKNINGTKILFVKPQTFMNLSGNAVGKIANYYKVDSSDILIIHDDLDLEPMTVRFKIDSSAGGHNGIKSIISSLGTNHFAHLKVGIGHNLNMTTADYVLSKLSKEEIENLKDSKFREMIEYYITDGVERAMNKYN